jgi:hypothetical protein
MSQMEDSDSELEEDSEVMTSAQVREIDPSIELHTSSGGVTETVSQSIRRSRLGRCEIEKRVI